jgi:hypothetical protein
MGRRRRHVRVALTRLEMTRGHDGFLRGRPEPVLLIAHLRAGGGRPLTLCSRLLIRFAPRGRFPLDAPALGEKEAHSRLGGASTAIDHLLLILAFEENSGVDIQHYHSLVESPDLATQLRVWQSEADVPAPVPLPAAAHWSAGPHRVRLLDATRNRGVGDAADACRSDTLVDAAVVPLSTQSGREAFTIPLRSDDERNLWSARVAVEVVTR